jgi:hypothetical protein
MLEVAAAEFPIELRLTRKGHASRSVLVQRPSELESALAVVLVRQPATATAPKPDEPPRPEETEFIFER